MYDCIIVGAGPAGSTVAYHLAKQGHSVLMLEKAPLARYKPCSGAVSPAITQWFDVDFTPVVDCVLRHVRYTWKLEDEVAAELTTPDPVWIVRRDVFDPFLAAQAQQWGAIVQDQTAVTGIEFKGDRWWVATSQGVFEGRYVVAADGADGPMSGWLGFKEAKRRIAAHVEVTCDRPLVADAALSFEFGLMKNGCMWSFPRQGGYGIGAAAFIGNAPKDFRPYFEQYIPAFGATYVPGQEKFHSLKLWDGHQPLHTQQAIAVGEAAAIVDPLTAEGIRHGIFSGVHGAAAIHRAIAGEPDALAAYTQTLHDWGNNMQWAQRIAGVFYRVPGVGYRVGLKRPSATERLGQLLTGEIGYGDIANRVIKRMTTGFLPGRK